MATMRSFLDLSTGTKQEQQGRVAIIKRGTKREQNPLAYNCGRNKARGWDKLSHPIWWGWVDWLRGAGKITHTYTYTYAPRKIFSKFQTFFFSFSAFQLFKTARPPTG